jgi:hypothetical protein
MRKYLRAVDRTAFLKKLTKEQRKTLFMVVGKRYRSYFSNVLAKYKGTKDWAFYGYIDHGRVRPDITCECGKRLRHQYILVNRKTKEKRNIGSTHFIEELQIPEHIAKEVMRGIHEINHDLDELLQKYESGWELPDYLKRHINKIELPKDIYRLLTMELPLLSRQVDLLYSKLSNMDKPKTKSTHAFIIQLLDGRSEYEIHNEDIYKVLIGKIDSFAYIESFRIEIDRFLKKKKNYTPIYDLINNLIEAGLPNELLYGQHALTKHVRNYLDSRSDIVGRLKDDGFMYYKLIE